MLRHMRYKLRDGIDPTLNTEYLEDRMIDI